MMHQPACRLILAVILLGAALACASAADPQKEILDGLRTKGHFAEAIDLLEHAKANPATPKSFAATIEYELAVTRIDWAAGLPESERDKPLELAQEGLAKFLADQPRHALAEEARGQMVNVLFDRGRVQRVLAAEYQGQARQDRLEAARRLLKQAGEQWAGIEKAAGEELKQLAFIRSDDVKQAETRDQVRRRQLQASLGRAWVQYEMGQTCPVDSAERTAAMQEAGNRFDALYEQQRDRLAGYYARLGRGLCSRNLGDDEKAFAIFEELLGLPDDPADFHALRGKAAVQALEMSLRSEAKKTKQGLDIARRWIEGDGSQSAPAGGVPAASEVDLAIRFLGGEAALAYAKTIPPVAAEQDRLRTQQIDWARQQFQVVAAAAGTCQGRAKLRLLDPAFGGAETAKPGTVTDARIHAKAALDRFLALQAEQREAERTGAGNDRDTQRQRREQMEAAKGEVLKYCRLASDLYAAARTAAQPVAARPLEEEYDTARYYLAYMYYAAGEFDKAAEAGETLARASGDSPAARQAARIGLAACETLCHRADGTSRPAAIDRLHASADRIVERWSNRAEADDARAVLLDLALGEGQLPKAEAYFKEISAASPRYGEAELNLGQALWGRAQDLLRTSSLEHDHTVEAEKMIARAADLLAEGIPLCRKAGDSRTAAQENADGTRRVPATLPAAVLALAQIDITEGRHAEAIPLLEDQGVASADSRSLALLAYVATGKPEKARGCFDMIQASLSPEGKPAAPRETLRACLRIRRLLAHYLAGYRDRRQTDRIAKIVDRFDAFLASLAEGPAAGSFFVMAWRAEAHAGLAAGLDGGGPVTLPDAEKQYRRAAAVFQEILARAATETGFSPAPDITVALRIDLARCLRRLSDNPHALRQLLEVLKNHPLMVDAQVEAAYTYQAWGDEKPEYLEMAIQGGKLYREVWGWGELARRVQPEARFREVFHEARYNLALCRLRLAQMATDRRQRARLAETAENDILVTARLCPDMGGAVWYDRYNELLKRIQRLADRPVVGLPEPRGSGQKQ